MGFLGELGKAVSKGITGGVGGLVSSGIGMLGGKLFNGGSNGPSQKELQEQAFNYQKELMALQSKYNKEAATQGQKYNKEMWDYTNYENQKKHLINAGLNPALLYGQSGGGGVTGEGAKQQGVGMPSGNPVEMGLQLQSIRNQQRLQEAQARQLEADANLKNTEAANKSTVEPQNIVADTAKKVEEANNLKKQGKVYEAQALMYEAQKDLNKSLKILTDTEENLKWSEIYKVEMEAQRIIVDAFNIVESTEGKRLSNKVARATLEDQIEQYSLFNANLVSATLKNYSEISLNDKQIESLNSSIFETYMRGLRHGWDAETFRKEVEGQLKRWQIQNGVDVANTAVNAIEAISRISNNLSQTFNNVIGGIGKGKAMSLFKF